MGKIIRISIILICIVLCSYQYDKEHILDRKQQLYFRKSGFAFANQNIENYQKIRYDGYYLSKSIFVDNISWAITMFPEGLMYDYDFEKNYDNIAKNNYKWILFQIKGDTILMLERTEPNTYVKRYYISMYIIYSPDTLGTCSFSMVIDQTLSYEENLNIYRNQIKNSHNSNFDDYIIFHKYDKLPKLEYCKWLSKKYFWRNDSLYNAYWNIKKNESIK